MPGDPDGTSEGLAALGEIPFGRYYGTVDATPLFVSKKGNRLALRTFNDLVNKWCAEAGIPHYSPHALRHTKAQRIMADIKHLNSDEQEKKLRFVNQQLRHKSWGATLIYTKPTKEQMSRVGAI